MSTVHRSPWLLSCMGGWCALRDHCQHYHAAREGTKPSERLCKPGIDGESDIAQVRITLATSKPAAIDEIGATS